MYLRIKNYINNLFYNNKIEYINSNTLTKEPTLDLLSEINSYPTINSASASDSNCDSCDSIYIISMNNIYYKYREIFYPESTQYNLIFLYINSLNDLIIIIKRIIFFWENNYNIDYLVYLNAVVYLQTKCNINYNLPQKVITYSDNNSGYIGKNLTLHSICDKIDILYR